MGFLIRALGIGLAAALAYLVMTAFDDGEGGANIGAGLAVFAVLAIGSFVWALLDGLDRQATESDRLGLGALLGRWVLVAVFAVVLLEVKSAVGFLEDWDIDRSSAVFLGLLVLVPSVIGAFIGYAARGTRAVGPDQTPTS